MTRDAARVVASEIAEAGGVEVFFIGRRGRDGLVFDVEAHAFGSERAVPVLANLVNPGEVIIHNHPSGYLEPSDADLSISAELGNLGVGSYIVDNECTRVRVVVRPHDPKEKQLVDLGEVERLLGAGSSLAREMGDFEDRPQQRTMSTTIAETFNAEGIAVVEAGTGTGKSLAYLVPSILYALANKQKVVISTHTITLQEQILTKDLPVVRRAIDREFRAELVKGRSNYVCKRKAQFAHEELASGQTTLVEDSTTEELRDLLEWAGQSEHGDRAERNPNPTPEAWERVVSESDNCLRLRCPHYESCFFYNSRRRAARADVIVVNHSLLLSDLAVRRETDNWSSAAVLPPYQHLVLDEAHHLEDVATRHLASTLSLIGLRRLFYRLFRADKNTRRGVLPRVVEAMENLRKRGEISIENTAWTLLVTDIVPSVESVRQNAEMLLSDFGWIFAETYGVAIPRNRQTERMRITAAQERSEKWHQELVPLLSRLAGELAAFIDKNRHALDSLSDIDEKRAGELINVAMEWQAQLDRLEALRQRAVAFLQNDPEHCRWIELTSGRRGELVVFLNRAPVSVAKLLEQNLHRRMRTEVLTSATLTVNNSFEFLGKRIGLSALVGRAPHSVPEPLPTEEGDEQESPPSRVKAARSFRQLALDTPFDYSQQVFFGVPDDIGDPRSGGYRERLVDFLIGAVGESDGRALILFTSYTQLNDAFRAAAPAMRAMGYNVLAQANENRNELLARFREDETSVLFATSSFWEGIDVRGRALELLVIVRLPFEVPTDPVAQAQSEYVELQGGNAFRDLSLPRAVIRLRQGFGRLIRSRTDRGAVIVTDSRIVTANYGRVFTGSLPAGVEVRRGNSLHVLQQMNAFFKKP